MKWKLVLILAVIAAGACAPRPELEVEPIVEEQLEYGPQCAMERQQARDTLPAAGFVPPRLLRMPLVPFPVPSSVRGSKSVIDFRVDSAGNPIRSLTTVTGLADPDYRRRVRSLVDSFRFRPAHIGRCAVEGKYQIRYDF